MGFLIRMAFWFSLVLLVLPLEPQGMATAASARPGVLCGARGGRRRCAASASASPEVCETGKAAMHTIGVRAREGARIAFEMLDETAPNGPTATTGSIATSD